MEIVTYAQNTPTVVNSNAFEFAIEYKSERTFKLLNELRVCEYSVSQSLDCSGVNMWLNGTIAGSTVITDTDGRQCCDFDTFGVYTRYEIENTEGNLFFLMNNAAQSDEKLLFERTSIPIVPNEVAVLYAFHLDDTELVIDGDSTRITLTVNNVDHSNNPDFDHSACNNKDLTMATIELSGCTLNLDAQTVPGKYEYLMPSVDYERCSSSVTTRDGQILYNSTIDLPDNDAQCYYFQPGNDIQPITVIIEQDSITDATQETTSLGVTVTEITTERCLPYEDYVLAHARIVYTVRYKFNGTDVNLINTPFLNDVTNPLTTLSKSCTDHECLFVLKSTQCEPIYTDSTDSGCVFDRNDVYLLNELSVNEVGNPYSPISYTHIIEPLDTITETTTYPLADCTTPDYLEFVNVTDQYNYQLNIQNVATADWSLTQPSILDVFQELVLQLEIIDGPVFTNQDLQLVSIKMQVEGTNGDILSTVNFRSQDKKAMMVFSGSKYYKDAHFCRHYDAGACNPFYDTSTSRSNPYVVSTLVSRLDEICQLTGDNSKMDFFSFLFPTWVKRIDSSGLRLNFQVVAKLQVCSTISNDSAGLPGNIQRDQGNVKIDYINAISTFVINVKEDTTVSPTKSPTKSTTVSPTKNDEDDDGMTAGVIAIIVIVILGFGSGFALMIIRKHKKVKK